MTASAVVSVLVCLLVFLAGFIACDLVRFGQERYRLYRITRALIRMGDAAEMVCKEWAEDPANWCNRPGCPRCWGGWVRS
ncbi:hypothetical protein [Spongiactinospora sp. TRM90649]|uniref:hypothetical protein n=1 Tax=Spongiactinospora sp. TRM90649 TaxID=3031114 RepID=UPI0023F93E22|nr:hypothetical protein [Spongiactinospora sp. TRM90649]MDF5758177.1 hypothetical protein [Spongiactinospora sp. TRM90649]